MKNNSNLIRFSSNVTADMREISNGHRGIVIWFTGLSGAGKSTIAHLIEKKLYNFGCQSFVLDADHVRDGLCQDLGFSVEDRRENIRRIREVAKLFTEAGLITIVSFISPFREDRQLARGVFAEDDFFEVYCKCSIDVCESRDVKGFYKRARSGEIANFTGITSVYEPPECPELTIDTENLSIDQGVDLVIEYLKSKVILPNC